jgi:hypothetical protein
MDDHPPDPRINKVFLFPLPFSTQSPYNQPHLLNLEQKTVVQPLLIGKVLLMGIRNPHQQRWQQQLRWLK